jgi:hypothetical protein
MERDRAGPVEPGQGERGRLRLSTRAQGVAERIVVAMDELPGEQRDERE